MEAQNHIFTTPEAELVIRFVNSTNRHIFLTGRAGTGKTTLLKQIVETTHKKTVIAAPTGIAAINAGGTTLHSLFHLPFGTFVPSNQADFSYRINTAVNTPHSLIKNLKMNAQKRQLLSEIELLVIDEVSMLRADILDAIDFVLRHVRRKQHFPFGGLQILFIGDLWQLPPVVKNDEVNFLKQYYSNFYFFNALALKYSTPVYIELEHIYRQSDAEFIELLNHFRTNQVSATDLAILNKCYTEGFDLKKHLGYIALTTHNHKADAINKESLDQLAGKASQFKAIIQDDFSENLYPVDPLLELKKGAQVMFIKNDYSGEQSFFNGKIGQVCQFFDDKIQVTFNDGSKDAFVERYTWENKRYSLNKETNEIEEKIIGKFTHFPLKLAWAITIHKSQGLTFNRAAIDISEVFASGQTYVALSRLTSLKGLILQTPVVKNELLPDTEISDYSNQKKDTSELSADLKNSSIEFAISEAVKTFDFYHLIHLLTEHEKTYDKNESLSAKQRYKDWIDNPLKKLNELNQVGRKFQHQLTKLGNSPTADSLKQIHERVLAAKNYFEPFFIELSQDMANLIAQVNHEKGIKKFVSELTEIDAWFYDQRVKFSKLLKLIEAIIDNALLNHKQVDEIRASINRLTADQPEEALKKSQKKDTKAFSLELYKAGKTISEIAKERDLTEVTVEGHLATYIARGELSVHDFVAHHKIEAILEAAREFDTVKLGPIKNYLGNGYSYTEIRFAVSHLIYTRFIEEK